MIRIATVTAWLLALPALLGLPASSASAGAVRIASWNIAMGLESAGELAARMEHGDDEALKHVAAVLQHLRPDIILLNEVDQADGGPVLAEWLQANYLSRPQHGGQPISYPHRFAFPVNTGVDSGLDLDGNGRLGDPADAWGFGRFPGQYAMLVLSRFPADAAGIRTFQFFRWVDMPDALQPHRADGRPFYPPHVWEQLRLSSKGHWDLPLRVGSGLRLHLLASHPTPPVFDGPEDRNGRRNHDEIRFWVDYLTPGEGGYIQDDAGVPGGLAAGAAFVIVGDLNADPVDGSAPPGGIDRLLAHPRVSQSCLPESEGGALAAGRQGGLNATQEGDPRRDTADFNDEHSGNLRVDYALPSAELQVVACGVHWPPPGTAGAEHIGFTDHRLVWVDIETGDRTE